jgi:hypothetical protein
MLSAILIAAVEQDGTDGVIVRFSEGTAAGYVVEELLELRPKRCSVALAQSLPVTIPAGAA